MRGYFLRGAEDEILLVFRSYDPHDIISIIRKAKTVRDKSIKELADELEQEFYDEIGEL